MIQKTVGRICSFRFYLSSLPFPRPPLFGWFQFANFEIQFVVIFFQILLRAVKHFASASRVQFVFCFVIGKSKIFILLLCFSHVYDLFPAHAHASETNRNDTKRTWNMHEKIVASSIKICHRPWMKLNLFWVHLSNEWALAHTHTHTFTRTHSCTHILSMFHRAEKCIDWQKKMSLVLKAQSQGAIAYFVVFYRLWQNLA